MYIYKPYTYLIGWSNLNKYYYGVRYAKNCNPSDLWTTYFTSSKHVKRFTKKHGRPNIILIRKIFNTKEAAINWENKVLRRLKVVEREIFLNYTYNKAIEVKNSNCAENLRKVNIYRKLNKQWYNETYNEEKRREISSKLSEKMRSRWKSGNVNSTKPEDTTNYKQAAKMRWSDINFKNRMKSKRWYNNPTSGESKMLSPEEVEKFTIQGWVKGRRVMDSLHMD